MFGATLKNGLGRRASFAVEFALVAPLFLVMLFVVFEVAYDELMQEALDSAVQSAARQVQIGNTQTATADGFVSSYLCPYANGLLNCGNLFVRVQSVSFNADACSGASGTLPTEDFYDATIVGTPVSNGVVQLGGFYSGNGVEGSGSAMNLSPCATSSSSTGYCNAGPQQFILLTGIYLSPSFLGALLPNHISYGGQIVRAIYSSAAFETEAFASASPSSAC